MLAFVASPFLVLAVLVYAMAASFERGPRMHAPPIGAGAGETGGANALGEAMFGSGVRGIPAEQLARGVVLVVRDASGRAGAASPIRIVTNEGLWRLDRALAMEWREDGSWEAQLPPGERGRVPLEFRFVLGDGMREVDPSGAPVGARRLPLVEDDGVEGALVFEFEVAGFGGGAPGS